MSYSVIDSLVVVVEAICAKKFTDTHTRGQTTDAAQLY